MGALEGRTLEIKIMSFDPCKIPKDRIRKKLKMSSYSLSMNEVNQIQKKLAKIAICLEFFN